MLKKKELEKRLRDSYQMFLSPDFLERRSTFARLFELSNDKERYKNLLNERLSHFRNLLRKNDLPADDLQGKVWLLTNTNNQYVTLSPLVEGVKDGVLVSSRFRFTRNKDKQTSFVNFHRQLWSWSAWKTQRQLIKIAKTKDLQKYNRLFHHYRTGFGTYEAAIKTLRHYRPKALVLSNDHVPFYRLLLHACKTLGIPTIYVQHACVADDFPPLHYDLSLLDGQDALDKYRANGKQIAGAFALVGIGKFDQFADRQVLTNEVANIGIPYSKGADFGKLVELRDTITKAYPQLTVTFRSHPGDKRALPQELASANFSHGKTENVFDFLQRQDLIIADDTSTHLEAVLMNISSWYYKFSDGGTDDIYGFVKNGLVERKHTSNAVVADLKPLLKNRPPVRHLAKRYYAPMDTPHDGNCIPLIVKEINAFLSK